MSQAPDWVYAFVLVVSAIMFVGGVALAIWSVRYGQKVRHLDWLRHESEVKKRDDAIIALSTGKTEAQTSVEVSRINAAAAVAHQANMARVQPKRNGGGRRMPLESTATPVVNEEGDGGD